MPIAALLGVQIDMQLLLKLTLSTAAVLLVSWAYRFYSSRGHGKPQLCVPDVPERLAGEEPTDDETCRRCKVTLRRRSSHREDPDKDGEQHGPAEINAITENPENIYENTAEVLLCQAGNYTAGIMNAEDISNTSSVDPDICIERRENFPWTAQEEVTCLNASSGSTLNLPSPRESGAASPTGRRSPCCLQRLEGSVGVGRELRKDTEHQGAFSSFLSKAAITVEDANLVMDGGECKAVHGKIYDYYVESSSHSITDSSLVLSQYERPASDSGSGEFRSRGSSLTEQPSSLNPIIMHDLVLPHSSAEPDPFLPAGCEQRHPPRPALLRKNSYLIAAEHSELPVPVLTQRASTPVGGSSTFDPAKHVPCLPSDSKELSVWNEPSLHAVASAQFFHQPGEHLGRPDIESLKGKLDLGNCMEVLALAKKQGQASLREAALQVMSDNYLHVLRDPSLHGRLMAGEREQIQKQRMKGRRFVVVADMDPQDWSMGAGPRRQETEQRSGSSSGLFYYDDYEDTWHQLCPIPQEVISKGCAMCTMDNYLFVAVGFQGTEREMVPSKRVFCYNPATSIWKEISPMNEARPHCKLVSLQGYIYAIGGECLSSVERYEPRTDRWTFVAPLPNDTFAVAHRATVCNGELFVSGGTLRYTLLRYNPKGNAWKPSLLMGSKGRTTEMVAVRNFLYRFDVNPLLGVSVYRYHTSVRVWYECSSKRLHWCPAFQCVAMDDNIYCVSRQFTMRFNADEVSPAFAAEDLSVLSAAKGMLFPFVLSLPDKKPLQTSV